MDEHGGEEGQTEGNVEGVPQSHEPPDCFERFDLAHEALLLLEHLLNFGQAGLLFLV